MGEKGQHQFYHPLKNLLSSWLWPSRFFATQILENTVGLNRPVDRRGIAHKFFYIHMMSRGHGAFRRLCFCLFCI